MSRLQTAIAVAWAAGHQIQTGYHISALNGIQSAILCKAPIDTAPWRMLPSWMVPYVGSLNACVPMRVSVPSQSSHFRSNVLCQAELTSKSARFGIVVALFTAGSLLGSLMASQVTPLIGRVGILRLSSFLCLLGSLFLAISNSTSDMVFSRYVFSSSVQHFANVRITN